MAEPKLFELNNGTIQLKLSNFGCTITSLLIPDKHGKLADVVLGFDTLDPYLKGDAPYFGCVVGRVANRVKDGKFSLDGVHYSLPINNPPNSLHELATRAHDMELSILANQIEEPPFQKPYQLNEEHIEEEQEDHEDGGKSFEETTSYAM
ncbi:PREDICTED: aldose 1-epimerase [Erythranthe guttata]|uniref:aldose 1-epimerase n=1 Tax=Erythranthe guttata TaxID=4155 RepID=UPI00064E06D2|nr:PREDICTED: aldose 1-epimerase [Erythranthe guttata]|eukprot:XP_012834182.1 PREDICTED: aldose 1-epimerase [Erythranthe guttata]